MDGGGRAVAEAEAEAEAMVWWGQRKTKSGFGKLDFDWERHLKAVKQRINGACFTIRCTNGRRINGA
ncbi:hypothetical protein BHM03_00061598 [Ensete ventricosum]|nr:hypothetical protein BHM03_00061598 [Ensete ventricosum]